MDSNPILTTLPAVHATLMAIIMALFSAYYIYIKQKKDEYSIKLISTLRNLIINTTFDQLTIKKMTEDDILAIGEIKSINKEKINTVFGSLINECYEGESLSKSYKQKSECAFLLFHKLLEQHPFYNIEDLKKLEDINFIPEEMTDKDRLSRIYMETKRFNYIYSEEQSNSSKSLKNLLEEQSIKAQHFYYRVDNEEVTSKRIKAMYNYMKKNFETINSTILIHDHFKNINPFKALSLKSLFTISFFGIVAPLVLLVLLPLNYLFIFGFDASVLVSLFLILFSTFPYAVWFGHICALKRHTNDTPNT